MAAADFPISPTDGQQYAVNGVMWTWSAADGVWKGGGSVGTQGPVGPQGPLGPQGPIGPQGPQGTPLFTISATAPALGPVVPGTAWWDSDTGRTFICYDDGTSKQWAEFVGAPGITGPQGPQGPTGAGAQGPAGPQGVVGPQGPTGAGAQGPAGPQGAVGPQGAAGSPGSVGSVGPQGPAGPQGAAGPAGAGGSVGPQGPAGPIGGTSTCVISNQGGAAYGDGNFVFDPGTGRATVALLNVYYDVNVGRYLFAPTGGSFGSSDVPKGAIDAKVIADQHFIISNQGGTTSIGNINDAYSAWGNISYQGGGAFHPSYDGTQNIGHPSYRWGTIYATVGTINTSDARLKKDVIDSPLGLAFIETLRPVQYKWIDDNHKVVIVPDTDPPQNQVVTTPGIRPHWGLIAQEVQGALKTAGFLDTGISPLVEGDQPLGLNYGEFVAPLVKAVQELSARVKALEAAP